MDKTLEMILGNIPMKDILEYYKKRIPLTFMEWIENNIEIITTVKGELSDDYETEHDIFWQGVD